LEKRREDVIAALDGLHKAEGVRLERERTAQGGSDEDAPDLSGNPSNSTSETDADGGQIEQRETAKTDAAGR
jgi:hypothetical protein